MGLCGRRFYITGKLQNFIVPAWLVHALHHYNYYYYYFIMMLPAHVRECVASGTLKFALRAQTSKINMIYPYFTRYFHTWQQVMLYGQQVA